MTKLKKATLAVLTFAVLAGLTAAVRAQDKGGEPKAKGALTGGYRGATVSVSGAQAAFIKKGDRVDVMVTFDAKMTDNAKEKVTATILQNVIVLNIREAAKLDDRAAVELLVNPNEAQYAALGMYQGDLSIVRRAEGDTEMHPMEMASFRKLFR